MLQAKYEGRGGEKSETTVRDSEREGGINQQKQERRNPHVKEPKGKNGACAYTF